MALELLSLLCTFENSSKCMPTSFDSDSFVELLKGLLQDSPKYEELPRQDHDFT